MVPFSLDCPLSIRVLTPEGWTPLEAAEGGYALARTALVELRQEEVYLTGWETPLLAVELVWPVQVAPGARVMGDAWERGYGDMGWRPLNGARALPWYFQLDEQGVQSAVGVKTQPAALASWYLDGAHLSLLLDTSVGPQGVRLRGRRLRLCQLSVCLNREQPSFSFACAFARTLCEAPRLAEQPIYGGNNWYYAYGNSSHQEILEDARFVAELAQGLDNRPFMVIDDGWQLTSGNGGCNGGPWVGNRLFPDMPGLARQMKEEGVRPGIWMRPLLTSENVPLTWQRHRTQAGRVLDPTHPDVVEYARESARRIAGWGFELIKHDFSTFDIFGSWGFQVNGFRMNANEHPVFDDSRTMAEVILELYRALRDGCGSALIIGCNTIGHLGAGLFEAQRTGDDTSGHCWERTRRMGVNTLAMRMPQHRAFFDCDADCVGLTDQVDWALNRQWMELLARSGTALFVSAAPKGLSQEKREAVRRAFEWASRVQSPAEPLDWQDNDTPEHWQFGEQQRSFSWFQPQQNGYPQEVWWR